MMANNYADAQLTAITRADWQRYREDVQPLEAELLGTRDATTLVDTARTALGNQALASQESLDRGLGRFTTAISPQMRQQIDRSNAFSSALAATQQMHEARLSQRDRNQAVTNSMLDIGMQAKDGAVKGLGSAANTIAGINSANAQAKAQAKAGAISSAAALGGMALMMM